LIDHDLNASVPAYLFVGDELNLEVGTLGNGQLGHFSEQLDINGDGTLHVVDASSPEEPVIADLGCKLLRSGGDDVDMSIEYQRGGASRSGADDEAFVAFVLEDLAVKGVPVRDRFSYDFEDAVAGRAIFRDGRYAD